MFRDGGPYETPYGKKFSFGDQSSSFSDTICPFNREVQILVQNHLVTLVYLTEDAVRSLSALVSSSSVFQLTMFIPTLLLQINTLSILFGPRNIHDSTLESDERRPVGQRLPSTHDL